MANNNKNKSTSEEVYSEEFRAKVNREGNHSEVILSNSPTNIVLRNVTGITKWENGATYTVTVTKVEPEAKPADNASAPATEGDAAGE